MTQPRHYYAIDTLRGGAALAVLFWHYQSFYYPTAGVGITAEERLTQPQFNQLFWLYVYGANGVRLFWGISGFVFAFRYLGGRFDGVYDFFVRRLARLYPLHLVTLLLVAWLQAVSWSWFGHFQIYPNNDVYHFTLQLFMASDWGLEKGYSFNGPIWSVSVEVLVYAVFLVTIPLVMRSWWLSAVFMAIGWALQHVNAMHLVVECATYFYSGIFVYCLSNRALIWGALALAIGTAGLGLMSMVGISSGAYRVFVLNVALIGIASIIDKVGVPGLSRFRWLGDISYSLYLLHVPVQIAVLIAFSSDLVPRTIVTSPAFLVGFLAFMIAISFVTHRYFEAPARKGLTTFLLRRTTRHELTVAVNE